MRSMQFAGKPIDVSPNRVFNCAYLPIDDVRAFSETMFLLLGGTGVGFSVQKQHVEISSNGLEAILRLSVVLPPLSVSKIAINVVASAGRYNVAKTMVLQHSDDRATVREN